MYEMIQTPLTRETLAALLAKVDQAKIGLIGDLCLDMYWLADMKQSELSRETPHYPLPVVEERYAPGGAGNAACNIAALNPGKLAVVGLVGTDWRGNLLMQALKERGIDSRFLVRDPAVMTNTYIKPLRQGISDVIYEDPRLDFENRKPISEACQQKVLEALNAMAQEVDVICVSDQMKFGCITPLIRQRLCRLGQEGKTVIVDSRDHAADYTGVTVKPNEVEASRAFGTGEVLDLEQLSLLAGQIQDRNQRLTLMTLGDKGCFVAADGNVTRVPACVVEPPIDFCGAGDTFLAGFGTLLASGATPIQAAQTANLCSAVTIKKIGTTGTATREEVLFAWDTYFGKESIL